MTALRVCILRSWRENRILCVTDQSEIHKHTDEHTLNTHTQESTQNTHTDTQSDTQLLPSHDGEDLEEAEPQRDVVQSTVRIKQSRVISYQVTHRGYCALIGCEGSERTCCKCFAPNSAPSPLIGHSDRSVQRGGGAVHD